MNDNQRYFVEEFAEDYQQGRLSRRDLLRRVLLITGSTAVTASTLLALGCGSSNSAPQSPGAAAPAPQASTAASPTVASSVPSATAAAIATLGATTMPPTARSNDLVVQPDDPAIRAQKVQLPGPAGPIFAYLAQPKSSAAVPGIIVVPENMGLVEPNMDIARRYAKEGFAALAIDLVSRAGGTEKYASDPAQIPALQSKIDQVDLTADLQASLDYLKTVDGVRKDRLGVTGFCFGGNQAFALATATPEILAAVLFYGQAKLDDLPKSKAAFLLFYGEADTRVTSQAPAVQQALQQLGRPVEMHIEPGAPHAFFNNKGQNYNAAAARDAWPRALGWFTKYLKA